MKLAAGLWQLAAGGWCQKMSGNIGLSSLAIMIRISTAITLAALLLPSPALPFCFEEAGKAYGISPLLLRGIARVESSMNPAAINRNTNGSSDLGLMQINSFWLKPLGTTARELVTDPCYNVMAGAWVLRDCLDRHGETWEAVGCYNATSRRKRVNYSWKVYRELLKGAKTKGGNAGERAGAPRNPPRPAETTAGSGSDRIVKYKAAPSVSSIQVTVMEMN